MPGQPVSVVVLAIDRARNRISLAFSDIINAGGAIAALAAGKTSSVGSRRDGDYGQFGAAKPDSSRRGKRKAPESGSGGGRPSKRG